MTDVNFPDGMLFCFIRFPNECEWGIELGCVGGGVSTADFEIDFAADPVSTSANH